MEAVIQGHKYTRIHPSELDLPKDKQTIWNFRNLTIAEADFLENALVEDEAKNRQKTIDLFLAIGFTGADNFIVEGKVYIFKKDTEAKFVFNSKSPWAKESIDLIPRKVKSWLFMNVNSDGMLGDQEAKNS